MHEIELKLIRKPSYTRKDYVCVKALLAQNSVVVLELRSRIMVSNANSRDRPTGVRGVSIDLVVTKYEKIVRKNEKVRLLAMQVITTILKRSNSNMCLYYLVIVSFFTYFLDDCYWRNFDICCFF